MKYAVVILDGAAGRPLDELGGMTSLEYANTPFLDLLAREGTVGLTRNVPQGCEPSSNVACMSIIGYDPVRYDIGRGAIEGAAIGIDLGPGDVALRMNLCCVADGLMKSYSTDNISTEDSSALADEIAAALDDETFELHRSVGFRHILVVRGHPELMNLSYHPAHNLTDKPVAGCEPQGEGAGLLVDYMRRADAILSSSDVNARRVAEGKLPATNAWLFWPGMRPEGMEPFEQVYHLQAGMLSAVDLLNGLAELTGIRRYSCPGISDGPDNDFAAQGAKAVEMLGERDLVVIHVEAPDTAGHDGSASQKVAAIEAIDREIVSRLVDYANSDELAVLALPDHPTPVELKTHSPEPVPFVMWGDDVETSVGERLTEREGARSGLVVDPGCSLMGGFLAQRL
ncbi:MAG: 2,3-bisphosphoglycerate-independent phosphoglycerate mutase [Coriobacteriales bacterium]